MKENENNVSKWDGWYKNLPETPGAFLYGDTPTYKMASDFLNDCETIEDWGCGGGGFLRYCDRAIGVDGSDTPFATKKFINLGEYTSEVDGIHIRHVFEHNYRWDKILRNALKSAKKKISITMFIPLGTETKEIAHNKPHGVDVPDMLISENEFIGIVNEYNPKKIDRTILKTATGYGNEELIFIEF